MSRDRHELIQSLQRLSMDMLTVGLNMSSFGNANSDPEVCAHAKELMNAAQIAEGWADGLKAEAGQEVQHG